MHKNHADNSLYVIYQENYIFYARDGNKNI